QIYSEYLSVICERGREVDVAAGLVAALTSGVLGAWDEMIIPRMDGEAVFLKLLIEALADAGLSTECIVTESAPYIPLPATWEAYLKALPSSRRYFLKRSLRDFDKWAAGQVTYHRAGNHQELQQGKSVLVALHNVRG